MNTKFIFVTGGVYSSLGKGITASSIGRILKQLGFSVTMQKLDPYLNVDPMYISPLQHGEVFITKDGAKADLDLGNYERFIDHDLNMYSTVTSGRIYWEVLEQERVGYYNGKTVQVVPHITNQVISKLNSLVETNQTDFAIVEIGGTVGDIESLPFIQAINEFGLLHKDKVLFAHCVPLISVASVVGELKTKPAQHSVKTLRSLGINPDLLLVRSSEVIDSETRYKLSWSTAIPESNIYECMDLKSTYFLPEKLYEQKIYQSIFRHFNITNFVDKFNEWEKFTDTIKAHKERTINVALIGENVELHDAYFSVKASLDLAAYKLGVNLKISWLQIANLNIKNLTSELSGIDAVIVTPCVDSNNCEKTSAFLKSLEKMNLPVLVYGRAFENMLLNHLSQNLEGVYGETINNVFIKTPNSIVGVRSSTCKDKQLLAMYNNQEIMERHFHEYEFNSKFISELDDNIAIISYNTNGQFADIARINNHPFFYGTYANIEFTSKPTKPNPLYYNFLEAAS